MSAAIGGAVKHLGDAVDDVDFHANAIVQSPAGVDEKRLKEVVGVESSGQGMTELRPEIYRVGSRVFRRDGRKQIRVRVVSVGTVVEFGQYGVGILVEFDSGHGSLPDSVRVVDNPRYVVRVANPARNLDPVVGVVGLNGEVVADAPNRAVLVVDILKVVVESINNQRNAIGGNQIRADNAQERRPVVLGSDISSDNPLSAIALGMLNRRVISIRVIKMTLGSEIHLVHEPIAV